MLHRRIRSQNGTSLVIGEPDLRHERFSQRTGIDLVERLLAHETYDATPQIRTAGVVITMRPAQRRGRIGLKLSDVLRQRTTRAVANADCLIADGSTRAVSG